MQIYNMQMAYIKKPEKVSSRSLAQHLQTTHIVLLLIIVHIGNKYMIDWLIDWLNNPNNLMLIAHRVAIIVLDEKLQPNFTKTGKYTILNSLISSMACVISKHESLLSSILNVCQGDLKFTSMQLHQLSDKIGGTIRLKRKHNPPLPCSMLRD
jgi:hypothetical protein